MSEIENVLKEIIDPVVKIAKWINATLPNEFLNKNVTEIVDNILNPNTPILSEDFSKILSFGTTILSILDKLPRSSPK
jgi:hypothetical protein